MTAESLSLVNHTESFKVCLDQKGTAIYDRNHHFVRDFFSNISFDVAELTFPTVYSMFTGSLKADFTVMKSLVNQTWI